MMDEQDYNLNWMTTKQCLDVKGRRSNTVYIFDKFEGDAFNHIKGIGYRYNLVLASNFEGFR